LLAVYSSQFGFSFASGLAVQILIHEMGHYIDIKRRGLPADLPMFLPGLGAYVRWSGLGVSLKTRAEVSLAGPLAGCLAAGFFAWMWWATDDATWAMWARAGAWLNLMNLIPILGSDGDHAFLALTRKERAFVLTASLAFSFLVRDLLLLGIALCAAFRLSTKDIPEQPSLATTGYFFAVLAALSGLLWFLPGHGFGAG
jgi:Zn-dependent protease